MQVIVKAQLLQKLMASCPSVFPQTPGKFPILY